MGKPHKFPAGFRSGRLTVLHVAATGRGTGRFWACRCDCGQFVAIEASYLAKGIRKSCGCLLVGIRNDLTGWRFGRLLVLGAVPGKKKRRGRRWRCRCDCGKETGVLSSNLVTGQTISCGCFRAEQSSARARLRPEPKRGDRGRYLKSVPGPERVRPAWMSAVAIKAPSA